MLKKLEDSFFRAAFNHTNVGLIITDPNQSDHPIIFVNKGFVNLTGYQAEEVVGSNCELLQGHSTEFVIDKKLYFVWVQKDISEKKHF